VPREKYLRLAPGDSAVLGDVTAARGAGGAYALTWGPFSYDALPPGHYGAQVRWESRQREWTDPGGSRRGTLPDVWLGTVESNRVELTLP
jgi:hypothetical protein